MKSFTQFLLSSIVLFNATSLLAMDPVVPTAIEKGAEFLGKELGVFGEKATSGKTTAVAYSPSGSSSSTATSAMVPGQRAVGTTAPVVANETGEENSTNQFLEDEICNNIYQSCLAKVALMSFE
ncbi:MAG TPA: hypothetical protein VJK54_07050, partial [Chthoniobacterales bacterium]|nr:hypothetical protein [Chthoniobacterales bacterium]